MAKKQIGDLLLGTYGRTYNQVEGMLKKFKILKNPNSIKILNIIEKKGPQTITQLQEQLKLKTFNNTFLNVKRLKDNDFVTTRKDHQAQGRPVYVDLSPKVKMYMGHNIHHKNQLRGIIS